MSQRAVHKLPSISKMYTAPPPPKKKPCFYHAFWARLYKYFPRHPCLHVPSGYNIKQTYWSIFLSGPSASSSRSAASSSRWSTRWPWGGGGGWRGGRRTSNSRTTGRLTQKKYFLHIRTLSGSDRALLNIPRVYVLVCWGLFSSVEILDNLGYDYWSFISNYKWITCWNIGQFGVWLLAGSAPLGSEDDNIFWLCRAGWMVWQEENFQERHQILDKKFLGTTWKKWSSQHILYTVWPEKSATWDTCPCSWWSRTCYENNFMLEITKGNWNMVFCPAMSFFMASMAFKASSAFIICMPLQVLAFWVSHEKVF